MTKTGYGKARLSQLLSPDHPFGERAGRQLAQAAGLPEDYFETMDPQTLAFAVAFDALPPHMKAQWEKLLAMLTPPPDPHD